jgi:hypothetical protein
MTFAQPLTIPTRGKLIGLPEAIDDSRLSDEVGKWNMQPGDLPSLMEYYVYALQLHEILGQVLDRQDTKSDKPSDAVATVRAVLSLDSEITEWRDRLPLYLRYDSSRELDPVNGAAGLEPIPDAEVVLDFPDLARRLHCRYEIILCCHQARLTLNNVFQGFFAFDNLFYGRRWIFYLRNNKRRRHLLRPTLQRKRSSKIP